MSIYTQHELNDGVVTGFADERIKAWHQARIPVDELLNLGRAFNGPVPPEVATRLIGWEPIEIPQTAVTAFDETTGTFRTFELPDRLSKFIANPNSGRVVNVAGSGYNSGLHITMRRAIEAAMDAECDIASVVCLGDGAHMGMSFRARDGVTIGGEWGGAIPYVGFNSSLTGWIATSLDTSTTLRVCDNTMALAAARARRSIKVRRTRNSDAVLTPAAIREALEIAFAETTDLVAELERLANITVTDEQLAAVLDEWKPLPENEGMGRTIATNQRAQLTNLFLTDERNVFGQSVAGLLQAHNTWQHWHQTARGMDTADARLGRMASRAAVGHVQTADEAFLSVVQTAAPELLLVAS